MKTNTNLISRLLLSCLLLFIFNFSAQAQKAIFDQHYPILGAKYWDPLTLTAVAGVTDGALEDLDQTKSPIWFKVNGNIAGPQPHNKLMNFNTTPATRYVTPGAEVEVNFNVKKTNANRYTLVTYTVAQDGTRSIYDYQSNMFNDPNAYYSGNNSNSTQGNSNQQMVLVPTCNYEIYFVKGTLVTEFKLDPNATIGSMGPLGNPYAYNGSPGSYTLKPQNDYRIIEFAYQSGLGQCNTCPAIVSTNDCVYSRVLEVIDVPNSNPAAKELIIAVISNVDTKTGDCTPSFGSMPLIGDVIFTNITPTHTGNNQPYQFRSDYQLGPQIMGYNIPGQGTADAFVFDQRNNHNYLAYTRYQSEIFRFKVTNTEFTRLSNLPANSLNKPEICVELTTKHPEPHQSLRPIYCSEIEFEDCGGCEVVTNDDCHYEDCCFDITFSGGVPGPPNAVPLTTLSFDTEFLAATCTRFGSVDEVVFTFPDVLSLPSGVVLNPNAPATGFSFSVSGNQIKFSGGNLGTPATTFAFDMPSSFFTDPTIDNIEITLNSPGGGTFTHSFPLVIIFDPTDPNNPVSNCSLIVLLPVELTSFTGKAVSEGIALNWKTASEKDNDRFEIERSSDGRNFEKIGTVKGNGTSNVAHSYSFLDKYAQAGINYYRLNQVDFGGTNERSHIIRVSAEKAGTGLGVQLIPNPCQDQNCTVQLRNIDTSAPITVELRDLTGRLIFSQQVPADQNSFQLPRVDSGNGIYILSARNGSYTAYQKIVIQ